MQMIVVRTQPTSTRNITGFLAMLRGSSMANERTVAIRTSAGSNSLRRRVCRRWSFSAWTSDGVRSGIWVGVSKAHRGSILYRVSGGSVGTWGSDDSDLLHAAVADR